MSNSVRPHRWQPIRLPRPWDSAGKNTGVGFHFPLQCMKVKCESDILSIVIDRKSSVRKICHSHLFAYSFHSFIYLTIDSRYLFYSLRYNPVLSVFVVAYFVSTLTIESFFISASVLFQQALFLFVFWAMSLTFQSYKMLQAPLVFFSQAQESTTSPRSPNCFHQRVVFRNPDMATKCA